MFREYDIAAQCKWKRDTNDFVQATDEVAAENQIVGKGTKGALSASCASPYGPPPKKSWWVP